MNMPLTKSGAFSHKFDGLRVPNFSSYVCMSSQSPARNGQLAVMVVNLRSVGLYNYACRMCDNYDRMVCLCCFLNYTGITVVLPVTHILKYCPVEIEFLRSFK